MREREREIYQRASSSLGRHFYATFLLKLKQNKSMEHQNSSSFCTVVLIWKERGRICDERTRRRKKRLIVVVVESKRSL
ncbi:hypothetical protein POPTR_001G298350v4 [Populus trichocarpa]|uniref:Uncharacterized protein n=1 Tax=Populus trichocarpa TaxID=3694 RepID=A0ACC0TLZ7_POPTR|nr:hypothetical protein POPTR_001G298350v4 [Populus trichocarpa]